MLKSIPSEIHVESYTFRTFHRFRLLLKSRHTLGNESFSRSYTVSNTTYLPSLSDIIRIDLINAAGDSSIRSIVVNLTNIGDKYQVSINFMWKTSRPAKELQCLTDDIGNGSACDLAAWPQRDAYIENLPLDTHVGFETSIGLHQGMLGTVVDSTVRHNNNYAMKKFESNYISQVSSVSFDFEVAYIELKSPGLSSTIIHSQGAEISNINGDHGLNRIYIPGRTLFMCNGTVNVYASRGSRIIDFNLKRPGLQCPFGDLGAYVHMGNTTLKITRLYSSRIKVVTIKAGIARIYLKNALDLKINHYVTLRKKKSSKNLNGIHKIVAVCETCSGAVSHTVVVNRRVHLFFENGMKITNEGDISVIGMDETLSY